MINEFWIRACSSGNVSYDGLGTEEKSEIFDCSNAPLKQIAFADSCPFQG
jgi:hypothetical protein